MSDLLCDNTKIRNVNTNAFLTTSDTMDCSKTNDLDFTYYNLLLLPTSKYKCINDFLLSLLRNFIQTLIMSKINGQSFCVQKSVQQAMNTNEEMLTASKFWSMELMQVLKNVENDVYKIKIVIPMNTMKRKENAISVKSSSQMLVDPEISFSARTAVIIFEMNNSISTISELSPYCNIDCSVLYFRMF